MNIRYALTILISILAYAGTATGQPPQKAAPTTKPGKAGDTVVMSTDTLVQLVLSNEWDHMEVPRYLARRDAPTKGVIDIPEPVRTACRSIDTIPGRNVREYFTSLCKDSIRLRKFQATIHVDSVSVTLVSENETSVSIFIDGRPRTTTYATSLYWLLDISTQLGADAVWYADVNLKGSMYRLRIFDLLSFDRPVNSSRTFRPGRFTVSPKKPAASLYLNPIPTGSK